MTLKEEIIKTVEIIAEKYMKKYKSDTTFKSVIAGKADGKYKIIYNNNEHTVYNGTSVNEMSVGTKVFVTIPSGEITDMFISGFVK